jgi:hypothetical protein
MGEELLSFNNDRVEGFDVGRGDKVGIKDRLGDPKA